MYKEHIIETEKLFKEVAKLLPDFERFDDTFSQTSYMEIVHEAAIYMRKENNIIPYRDTMGNLITPPSRKYCFISSGINPNGLDSSKRIGRDYTIDYFVNAQKRLYRHKYFYECNIKKFYSYAESIEEIINKFKDWLYETGERKTSEKEN